MGTESAKGSTRTPHPGQKKVELVERWPWGGRVRVGIWEGDEKWEMEEWTS